ncbi:MAG TPA: type II toxin-antitoxin system HicB family antitoxin [Anaerolineae bacterium]|nr:type II toxin-antitoxin system HicB family antitoxin [Anaerolineae bacterium]HQI84865.1 type II toxin-antitoxin system HicB family antitoxin [Anaerolineae bacterium]
MLQLHTIRVYLEPNPNGVFTVTSPDVPGLVTEGSTPDEIWRNVQEALDALKEAWQMVTTFPTGGTRIWLWVLSALSFESWGLAVMTLAPSSNFTV